MKGRHTNMLRKEEDIFMITIWRSSLDYFWSPEPGIVRGNITMMIKIVILAKE